MWMWVINLWICGTLILSCWESFCYNLIKSHFSQNFSESQSQANQNKQAWRKCSSTTLLQSSPQSYKTDRLARHWLASNHQIRLWEVTKKTSRCLWFSSCPFQSYMQQWWEMNLPQLSLKGSTDQGSIKKSIISYRASERHIPLCHSPATPHSLGASILGVGESELITVVVSSMKSVTSL